MSANDGDMKMRAIVVEGGGEMSAPTPTPKQGKCCEYTLDGSVDIKGRPAVKGKSGGWLAGALILVNQGLATLAFFGVNVNLVLFLTRVMGQSNEDAANNVSKWTGTVYMFSLIGAFLSDSYWGRYKTCAIFQAIFVLGLALLSVSSHLYLIRPDGGCGTEHAPCGPHSGKELGIFYIALYMIAFGNGGYQPNIATLGADQFDEDDPAEAHSKVSFFSYFYLALNLGSLFSNTFLSYLEDKGSWALGFWASTAAAATALLLFLSGTLRYRYFQPGGNPIGRICQVAIASCRNWKAGASTTGVVCLYEGDQKADAAAGGRTKLLHTQGFSFLDRAAHADTDSKLGVGAPRDPWKLCTVTQVEEVKSILRLLPIWLCTILYSVVFTQMASLFVVQGAAMRRTTPFSGFDVPASSMSAFDILTVATTIFLYRRAICPFLARLTGRPAGPTELQRMGLGLVVGALAMATAGTVEHFRKARATAAMSSDLHIMWQVPQYALIGVSEVMMYVGQLEFFNGQMPDGLKSFGSALCMMSMSLGNYFSDVIVSAVGRITTTRGRPGWIPADLNEGHLDKFYFLLAVLAVADFAVYLVCASRYGSGKVDGRSSDDEEEGAAGQVTSSPAYA